MFKFSEKQPENGPSFIEIKTSMTEDSIDFDKDEQTIDKIYSLIGKKTKTNDTILNELTEKSDHLSLSLKIQQESHALVTRIITQDSKYLKLGELKNLLEKKYPGPYQKILNDLNYFQLKRKNKGSKDLLKYWEKSSANTQTHLNNIKKQINLLNGLKNASGVNNQEKTEATLFGIQQADIITEGIIKNVFTFQRLEKTNYKRIFLADHQARGLETNPSTAIKKLQMIRDFELSFCDKKINDLMILRSSQPHNINKINVDIKHLQETKNEKTNYFSKLILGAHKLAQTNITNDNLEILNEKKAKGKNSVLIEKAKAEIERFNKYSNEATQHIQKKYKKFNDFLASSGETLAQNNTDLIKQLFFFDYKKNQSGIKNRANELKQIETKIKEFKQYFSTPHPEKERQEKIKEIQKYFENNKPLLKIKTLDIILENYFNGTEENSPLYTEIENTKNLSALKKFFTERINSHRLTLKTIEETKKQKKITP
jgi:hypothetical protein